ncbi:integrase [Paraburkholderia sp. WC7.3g]|uniref:phage integrase family protein n=1 Tax=Paraburkholderia sp. WC7.3g TaxID=2991070 RepID=UPI003D19C701
MANQPQTLTVAPPRTYTRTDFAALRAFVQRIEPAAIARRYYDADDPQQAPHAATPEAMARYLGTMRDELVRLALINGSSVLADHLKTSIRKHGSAKLTAVTLRMVEQAAQLAVAAPAASHGVGLWFRPLIARRLTGQGIATLGALIDYCNTHGGSWWRSVPRIGPLRARTIVAWLRRHEATLGARVDPDVDARPLTPAVGEGRGTAVVIGGPPEAPRLAPFERLAVPSDLSGGEGRDGVGRRGTNRATAFAYIRAPHDLAAFHAYLHRYRDRPPTCRAYTRELERLVLWAVIVRGVAVSSMTVEDCDAYKDFLAAPSPAFTGPKRSRSSGRWRPFTGTLSAGSQAYAVRTLRAAFAWLVDVRYLAGNPWAAVTDPVTVTREVAVQVERALPAALWATVRSALDTQCRVAGTGRKEDQRGDDSGQWRAARAAILLMGDSGLRRAEAAAARREELRISPWSTAATPVWALTVIGKRRRQRTVPVSAATVHALRLHWADRGREFDGAGAGGPLIAPQVIPGTRAAQDRHGGGEAPYAADALARLVRTALTRLTDILAADGTLPAEDLARLNGTSAHAFRHTFGTGAVARDMPVDVVQQVLGHASLQTTSIYVRAGQQRMLEAAARYYASDDDPGGRPKQLPTTDDVGALPTAELKVT